MKQSTANLIALREAWWIRWRSAKPKIKPALDSALLQHWVEVVEKILVDNEDAGSSPYKWETIADAMSRSRENVWRWRKGHARLTAVDFLCFASVLDVPVGSLLPDPSEWLANGVYCLCGESRSRSEIDAYVYYALHLLRQLDGKPVASTELHHGSVETAYQKTAPDFTDLAEVETAIIAVAETLEPILRPLEKRTGSNA